MWIAWQVGLTQKPEVVRMARKLKMNAFEVAARCMVVWEWTDANMVDCHVASVTTKDLSETVRMPGFCEAMRDEGWILEDSHGLTFPNFERWNGKTGKSRLIDAKRQKAFRKRV